MNVVLSLDMTTSMSAISLGWAKRARGVRDFHSSSHWLPPALPVLMSVLRGQYHGQHLPFAQHSKELN